ncbi:MAG: SpoIIE family protein phosphatase [Planctomycetota bacterium]|nr:SpoIIE family protein phosphatase [Planctomycetota bacterium]
MNGYPGFDIAGRSVPADATGGDFYDYVPLPGGGLAVVLGDVSGHGFGPALLSATAKSFLRSLIMTQEDAGKALSLTNELIIEESLAGQFVTVMALVFDSQTGSLRYVGAGHESYVFDRNGALKLTLASTGFPLGLESGQSYSLSDPVLLEPGDFIVALTDGVVEAASPKGELFGKARLTDSMKTVAQFSAEHIVESLYEIVEDFRRDKPQNDDITAVVVKFRA